EPDLFGDRTGGFWTSTYSSKFGCDWLREKIYLPHADVYNGYLFSVNKNAEIFIVDSFDKANEFESYYKGNYNNLAIDYQAINLTQKHLDELNKIKPFMDRFYLWGVESTWWFDVSCLNLIRVLNGTEISKLA